VVRSDSLKPFVVPLLNGNEIQVSLLWWEKKGRKNCLWVEVHKFSTKSALKQHDRLVNAIHASKEAHHYLNHYSQTGNRKPCFSTTQRSSVKKIKKELIPTYYAAGWRANHLQ
jgi:hypothetical protein